MSLFIIALKISSLLNICLLDFCLTNEHVHQEIMLNNSQCKFTLSNSSLEQTCQYGIRCCVISLNLLSVSLKEPLYRDNCTQSTKDSDVGRRFEAEVNLSLQEFGTYSVAIQEKSLFKIRESITTLATRRKKFTKTGKRNTQGTPILLSKSRNV